MFAHTRNLTNPAKFEYPLGHPPERMPLASVRARDGRVIVFGRVGRDEAQIGVEHPDRMLAVTALAHEYVLHSPTGLEFGYGGSGPADTALNILSLVVSPREAWRLHQDFKFEHIATIPREGGRLAMATVREWIAARYDVELADSARMADEQEQRDSLAEIARLDSASEHPDGFE